MKTRLMSCLAHGWVFVKIKRWFSVQRASCIVCGTLRQPSSLLGITVMLSTLKLFWTVPESATVRVPWEATKVIWLRSRNICKVYLIPSVVETILTMPYPWPELLQHFDVRKLFIVCKKWLNLVTCWDGCMATMSLTCLFHRRESLPIMAVCSMAFRMEGKSFKLMQQSNNLLIANIFQIRIEQWHTPERQLKHNTTEYTSNGHFSSNGNNYWPHMHFHDWGRWTAR